MSRVIKTGNHKITNSYANHSGWSKGVDVAKEYTDGLTTTDYVIAHSEGRVIKTITYMKGGNQLDDEGVGYGNYVMLLHNTKYQGKYKVTLYAHLDSVQGDIIVNSNIPKAKVLGFMGNTGGSYGAHLHFEIRLYHEMPDINNLHDTSKFIWIDPTPYLDSDLPEDVTELNEGSYSNYPDGSNKYYRIRRTFTDSKSSKGSYSKWANAFNSWKTYKNEGYHIYNNEGKQLDVKIIALTASSYPNYASASTDYYRVRTSFDNASSSKGSYHNFESAFNSWKTMESYGYHIYNKDGKQLD